MEEKQGNEQRRFVLRVAIRYRKTDTGEEQQKNILTLDRSEDGAETDISLPEADDIVDTGWIPEIAHRRGELEIVIRPDMTPLQRGHPENEEISSMGAQVGGAKDGIGRAPPDVPHIALSESNSLPVQAPETLSPPGTEIINAQPPRDEVLYAVTFVNREVRVNGFRLSKPNFNSENELVFDFLFRNANRRIELSEIAEAIKRPLTKKLREVVRDLGFIRELKEIFFPDISKTSIRFVNPVTRRDFEVRELHAPGMKLG